MPSFKITTTAQGGQTVTSIVVEKVGREQALAEGIPELLLLPNFPPEAVQFYREAIGRGFSRDEACDTLLEKWNLQFWCDEQKGERVASAPPKTEAAPTQVVKAALNAQVTTTRKFDEYQGRRRPSPRTLLREELKGLNSDLRDLKTIIDQMMKEYTILKTGRDQCRRMLKAQTPAKVTRGKRNLQSVSS